MTTSRRASPRTEPPFVTKDPSPVVRYAPNVRLMSVPVGKVLLSVFAAVTLAGCTASGHAVFAPTAAPTVTVTSTAAAFTPFATGYGQNASTVAHDLGTCRHVRAYSRTVARCVTSLGGYTAIATSPSPFQQALLVAMNKDQNAGDCLVAMKGVVISAHTEAALTEAIGVPEQFAADHHGYTLCPIR